MLEYKYIMMTLVIVFIVIVTNAIIVMIFMMYTLIHERRAYSLRFA